MADAPPTTGSHGRRARLILVDDHRLLLELLSTFLAQHYDVVGVAASADELLAQLQNRSADCILLDLEMPGRNGLELIPAIRRVQPSARILVVTMMLDRGLAEAALAAGACGFVPKEAGSDELRMAIAEVLAGRRYVSPRVSKASRCVALDAGHLGLHRLTPRQQEIFFLMGEGRSESEIADSLQLGASTITFHKHNIMRALGIESDAGLLRYAVLLRTAITE